MEQDNLGLTVHSIQPDKNNTQSGVVARVIRQECRSPRGPLESLHLRPLSYLVITESRGISKVVRPSLVTGLHEHLRPPFQTPSFHCRKLRWHALNAVYFTDISHGLLVTRTPHHSVACFHQSRSAPQLSSAPSLPPGPPLSAEGAASEAVLGAHVLNFRNQGTSASARFGHLNPEGLG